MIIREMGEGDVEAAVEINSREFGGDSKFTQKKFGKALDDSVVALVGEEDGKVIGYVIAVPRPMAWTQNTVYIKLLGVRKNRRGKGFGSRLLEKCIEELKEKGYEKVELLVPAERKRAQGLYKKFGFSVTDYKMKKRI